MTEEATNNAVGQRHIILALLPEVRKHRDMRIGGKTPDERERAAAAYALTANRIIEALLLLYDLGADHVFASDNNGGGRCH